MPSPEKLGKTGDHPSIPGPQLHTGQALRPLVATTSSSSRVGSEGAWGEEEVLLRKEKSQVWVWRDENYNLFCHKLA